MTNQWKVGQLVVLDGKIVKIERVTPSGIAFIGYGSFRPDGYERNGGIADVWRRRRIVEPTGAILAKIKREAEERKTIADYRDATDRLTRWARGAFPFNGGMKPGTHETARALIDAINNVLNAETDRVTGHTEGEGE